MRSSTIDERFTAFVEEPSSERFLLVRERVVGDPLYDPYSDALRCLELDHENRQYQVVLEEAAAMDPVWRLSPRFHYLAGTAALELGDHSLADRRRRYSLACMTGLFETGDGSPDSPYVVTYLSDEYDLMRYLDAEIEQQQIVEADGLNFDVLISGEEEFWFDVTELVAVAGRSRLSVAERQRPIARQV